MIAAPENLRVLQYSTFGFKDFIFTQVQGSNRHPIKTSKYHINCKIKASKEKQKKKKTKELQRFPRERIQVAVARSQT